jgi:trimeric autotransporter adhesin
VGSSSAALSGNTYTLNLAVTFQSGFSGAKNISGLATSMSGVSSAWQTLGTWTATGSGTPTVRAASVGPSSGSGASQTFTFVYTDSSGVADLAEAQALISTGITSVSSCYVWVTPGTGAIWLASNTGSWLAPSTLGMAGTLQNSQCAINVGSSSAALSGSTYTLSLTITFQSGFSGAKNVYGLATSVGGVSTGWQTLGTWTPTGPAIGAVSVSPLSGSGVSRTFTFVYTDSSGASDFASAQALINASITGVSSCYVWVTPGTGAIWLASNTGTWPTPSTLGTAGTLQNSQCAVNVGSSSGVLSGNTYTLTLSIGFESGFTGAKNIYGLATSVDGVSSGWATVGTWTP